MRADRREMDVSTPLKAIRAMCLECVGYVSDEVKACTIPDCPLYPFRLGRSVKGKSRLKAIKQHCHECMGGSLSMWSRTAIAGLDWLMTSQVARSMNTGRVITRN